MTDYGHPDFDVLFNRMREIDPPFEPRLPRFDHLERLARTHNFFTVPTKFYAEEASGPLDGLTYLLFGLRLSKNRRRLEDYLVKDFPKEWNSNPKVDKAYRVSEGTRLPEVLRMLEKWTIEQVRKSLPRKHQDAKSYIFDLESCLCNWQKRK